ncbi:hypothetical protein [Glutamicibacter sp. NPDC087583]|uniref:hypothetical protein n=1 Tax=Glutamicibacter sp. NPDC087583 TaxID=3363995 RepID=UPI003817209A
MEVQLMPWPRHQAKPARPRAIKARISPIFTHRGLLICEPARTQTSNTYERFTLKLVAVHQANHDGSLAERTVLSGAAKESLDALITPGKPYLNPLLGQLSQAIKPSGFGEGGTVPEAHEKSVLNLEAMTLLDQIRQTTAERLALITREAPPTGTLAEQLVRLLDLAKRDEDERLRTLKTVANLFAGWVRRIESVFNPAPACSIQGPCISCGEEHAMVREDGVSWSEVCEKLRKGEAIPETVILKKDALVLRGEKLICLECEAAWTGFEEISRFKSDQDKLAAEAAQALRAA